MIFTMIHYTDKLPNKVDYYELLRTVYDNVDVSEISSELESSIACVCVYNGERLVGMGRVKKEENYLCIEDLIVRLEDCKEEIQNCIIVNLFEQINKMKNYDMVVRDCLNMRQSNEDVIYQNYIASQQPVTVNMQSTMQLNGYVRA